MLNLLDSSILGISSELRKIALIIILTRAGLGLDLSGLKKIGRPAVLMCFVPASFELLGMILIAPKLMGLSLLEAAIMGAVLAAVSSTDAPARISCGIPSFTPYPSSISLTILGTTTAGETAASTAPIIAASNRLNPIS